jgi:hypothetical protein
VAATASQFPLAPSPAIFKQRRVDALLSLQKAAQQVWQPLDAEQKELWAKANSDASASMPPPGFALNPV